MASSKKGGAEGGPGRATKYLVDYLNERNRGRQDINEKVNVL
jgi:hypothetical protein